jgi:hypothetical protein
MDTILLTARPVTVEARRFESVDQAEELARWCKGWTSGTVDQPRVGMFTNTGSAAYAGLGDWMLRGSDGTFYPAPNAVVDAKYDRPVSSVR